MGSNIAQVLRAWAVRDPDRVAVVLADEGERALTYAALDARARGVASRLASLGVHAGDRIALSVPNGLGFLDAWFGGLYAGCTLLPIPPMSAPPELAARLAHARCKALVSDPTTRALADAARASCPDVISLDAHVLADEGSARPIDVPRDVSPGDTAMVLYTSGTTAGAKGAMISHASLAVHTAALVHHVLALDARDEVLAALPLTHSYGIRMTLLAPFYAGARCRLLARFSAARVRALLHAHDVTWLPGVPTMFHALAHDEAEAGAPRALRWCLSAGAPLPHAVRTRAEARLGVPVRQGFGLTEATFSTIATPDDAGAEDTVGRAVFGVEVRVVDEAGEVRAAGTSGEVEVRGQNVMTGYLDDPAATAAALHDGWLRTGDVGVLDDAGRLTLVDRLKDVILRGGFNVYPAEVESVLLAHASVRDAVVVGAADEQYGEEVVAVLVRAPEVALDLAALAAHCAARLSKVKVPRLYAVIEALPVGPSGKVLRREVRTLVRAGALAVQRVGA
ncbi:MAG: AMP-binding protein [Polyangiales bacterium]